MRLLQLILFLTITTNIFAQLTLEGKYTGINLYVQNPINDADEYCVDSVLVNNLAYIGEFNENAFEVKIDSLGIDIGDYLKVEIFHNADCTPKILNDSYHFQADKFSMQRVKINDRLISWETKGDVTGHFEIQVYQWNKWVTIDSMKKQIRDSKFEYSVANKLHSGENTFRIKFVNTIHKVFVSKEIMCASSHNKVEFVMDKKTNVIAFSAPTRFEIYDAYGNQVIKGHGDKVNIQNLRNKLYYLNLDNRNVTLKLKR